MDWWTVNWHNIVVPSVPILETLIRGSLTYFLLFGILRLIPNRHIGTIGIADLLVIVLLTTAIQNGFTNGYHSFADGVVLVLTITVWSQVFNWLGFHVHWFQRLMRPAALPLVRRGRMILSNMRRELITEDELMSQIRQQGVDDLAHVKTAHMEGDGRISVVAYADAAQRQDHATKAKEIS